MSAKLEPSPVGASSCTRLVFDVSVTPRALTLRAPDRSVAWDPDWLCCAHLLPYLELDSVALSMAAGVKKLGVRTYD